MKKMLYSLILSIVVICCFSLNSFAQTGWVSDMLLLTFRQGPGNNYNVIKTLKSNTEVTILGEENGFYNVELQSQEHGWVDKKFIVFDRPKAIIISQLKQENENYAKKIESLELMNQEWQNKFATLESEFSQKSSELESSLKSALNDKEIMDTSLSQSKEAYTVLINQSTNLKKTIEENKTLKQENQTISKSLEILKNKNKGQFKVAMIKWFLAGVGVLLLGWIIGQSVSKKKSQSGSLLG